MPPSLDRSELAGDYAAAAQLYCLDCSPAGPGGADEGHLGSVLDLPDALGTWARHRRDVHGWDGR
jgi:hypothetical protein